MASAEILKPDRKLLDPKFNGYKLTLDSVPTYKYSLNKAILQVHPSDDQYSLQHVKLFSHHNHLHSDEWNPDILFYVDTSKTIHQIKFEIMHFEESKEVFQCPKNDQKITEYNVSINFPSKHLALVGDGSGILYLLETGDRTKNVQWKVLFSADFESASTLLHAVSHSEKDIACLLISIDEKKSYKEYLNESSPFVTVLHWINLMADSCNNWSIQHTRKYIGIGTLEYASLNPSNSSMYIAASSKYNCIYDSTSPVNLTPVEAKDKKEKPPPFYAWTQSLDEVIVILKLPKDVKKNDIAVTFSPKSLKVDFNKSSTILNGQLFGKINSEESTWTLENEKLELIMPKTDEGLIWQEIIIGDDRGEEMTDLSLLDEIYQRLVHFTSENIPIFDKKPAYNSQELEECDAYPSDFFSLMCFDDSSHNLKQQINLSSNQWLFNAFLSPEMPVAFCIRHDVDGIVWQPTNDGHFQHKITFNAFGYVQASKQERKFSTCSPNGSYAVISDVRRHIYLYHQPTPITSTLRNRHTGQNVSTVAQQQVISLDSAEDIFGMQVTDHNVYVLTKDVLYCLRIKME